MFAKNYHVKNKHGLDAVFFPPPVVRWLNQNKDQHSRAGAETFATHDQKESRELRPPRHRRLPSFHRASFITLMCQPPLPPFATNVCRFNSTVNHAEPFASLMGRCNVAAGLSETKQRERNVLEHVPSSHTLTHMHTHTQTNTNKEKPRH